MNHTNDPVYREAVRQIQNYLYISSQVNPKITRVNPDGIYGESTAQAVAAFQTLFGLPSSGRVDFATWQALLDAYRKALPLLREPESIVPFEKSLKDKALSPGDRSELVRMIRLMLRQLGQRFLPFSELADSDEYDEEMEDAIFSFQRIVGLPVTGIVDLLTWNRLAESYRESSRYDQ